MMADQSIDLNRQHSMLDLIDSSTLTSLPLAPPPKPSNKKSRYNLMNRSHSTPNVYNEIPAEELSFTSIDTLTTQNMTTENMTAEIDESFDESEDAIILVEDYMNPPKPKVVDQNLFRKQSLANFKQRLQGSEIRSKRKILGEHEDIEQIFGKIPSKSMLKYCDICDKPLYEISSIINNKRVRHGTKTELSELFNEFICFECIETYEEFLNELSAAEQLEDSTPMHSSTLTELKNLKLLNMFKTIQARAVTRQSAFSATLISKLKFLNSTSYAELEELNWLKSLQNKVRWRWRLNRLFPSFKREAK